MGRPREHGTETRTMLLEAAGRVLAAEGAGAVSVRRVAGETGTTTRAVYTLFGDKAGLMAALFREVARTMRSHHEAVPADPDPVAELFALAFAYRAGAKAQPNLYHLYLGRAVPDLRLTSEDIALAYSSFERPMAALQRCADQGRLKGKEPMAVGQQVWALLHGLTSLELQGLLGDEASATQRWRDSVAATLAAYVDPS